MREVRIHLAFAAAARRSRPGHLEAGGAALLPARHPGADAAQGQFRQGSGRARESRLQRAGAVRELPRPAALHRAGAQPAHAGRDGHRFVPGRPLADPRLPHGAACGTLDASEGRLLSRRPLRHAAGRHRALQQQLQTRAERSGKRRADRVLEVAMKGGSASAAQYLVGAAPLPVDKRTRDA